ncbi:GntR family transcriptional regulator [Chelatococcus sp. SYSU_G07232]|uniref:GntR family transcriptional regulator n=1 Tax=Chelatococcus albus TaxID=3047466 RepID=A0ABT7AC95_9HYPH|nr:GntR family transcriptional regulator [Chelatococcus sp. SYSU_G07232]MDJ1156992.1 GntR family transcriptional regulator [Chelatococcus sp. SYSU_G07232]
MKRATGEGDDNRTVAERIARALGERIVAGDLAPDTRLRQDRIASEFSASHVPVREAFRRLEAQGLVISEPRRGVRVAPLDMAAIKEIAEMRAALEVLALRHAAPRLGPADLARADAAIREGDAAQNILDWETANRAFHRALTAPCRMPRLLAAIDELQVASSRFLFVTMRPTGWRPRSNTDHRLILSALEERNVEKAASLLARHIQSMERLAGLPAEGEAGAMAAR